MLYILWFLIYFMATSYFNRNVEQLCCLRRFASVSYTHLDVYKRQYHTRAPTYVLPFRFLEWWRDEMSSTKEKKRSTSNVSFLIPVKNWNRSSGNPSYCFCKATLTKKRVLMSDTNKQPLICGGTICI